jgi:hypothetical protein
MKLVKSLLLGSAAGIVAVGSAVAADLPVRQAAPVDYVQVCSAFGTGFFYIPGTDTCLRIGGSVRMDVNFAEFNQRTTLSNRGQNTYSIGGRARITTDARTATEFGTLRSFIALEHANATGDEDTFLRDAFIEFAGFKVGRISSSAFEYYTSATYFGSLRSSASTFGNGANTIAYTADFGDFSATIALEDNNARRVTNGNAASIAYGGRRAPEIVGNVQWTQGWGGVHLGLAAHQIYSDTAGVGTKWGYAAILGTNIKLPMLAPGSEMWLQGSIGEGALHYTGVSSVTTRRIGVSAANAYVDGTSIRTTTSWSLSGGLRHNWTPQWQSNLHASYGEVTVPAFVRPAATVATTTSTANSFNWFSIEKNIIWRPVSGLQIGAEVQYQHVNPKVRQTALNGRTVSNDGIWAGRLRIQRDF